MYRMSAFSVVSVFVVLLLLIAAPHAAASTITLDDPVVLGTLLDGGSITVGDKFFDQFSYSPTGDMPGFEAAKEGNPCYLSFDRAYDLSLKRKTIGEQSH